jgi:hypothetical protein
MYLKSVDPGTLNLPETIQIDRWVCPLTTEIKNFFTGIDNEIPALTEPAKKKRLKAIISNNNPIPVVDFEILKEHHLLMFVLSLKKMDGSIPGFSTFNTHRAGFNHLFRIYRKKQPDEMGEELSLYFRSLKKRDASRAQEGIGPIHSTKLPLPFDVYRLLAKNLLIGSGMESQHDSIQNIFGHTFWVLSWNIMARSINTANISLRHMDWNGDALHIYICQAKNDQEGEKSDFPKHVFANPVMPEICPILAIGIYFLVIRFEPNQSKLFEGSNQADRFRQILQRLCALDAVRPSLADLGFDSAKLGVHSTRKGAATFCASGSTHPPSQASIDIRGGWSQGKIKDVYQHYQAAGDQYVGRTVSGLPRNDVAFATLPPHFGNESREFVREAIINCFPTIPAAMIRIGEFCLASLVYHYDYLVQHIGNSHILHQTELFRNQNLLNALKDLLLCGQPNLTSVIQATGLPPDIMHTLEIRKVPGEFERILEERSILANSVTPQLITTMMDDQYRRLRSLMRLDEEEAPETNENRVQGGRRTYLWNGHFHFLPENYVLPKISLHLIWQHWWLGNNIYFI